MKKLWSIITVCILMLSLVACSKKNFDLSMEDTVQFSNSVFIGDSVTEGFSFNKILKEENVLAGAGATAGFAMEDMDILIAKNPEEIFIMLGQCDILMPVEEPKELFYEDYLRLVQMIQEKLPDSKIYLQSILPVTEDALTEEPRYKEIATYNKIIQQIAEELSVNYIDLSPLVQEHLDLYAEDGIHFQKEFYTYWLNFLSKLF